MLNNLLLAAILTGLFLFYNQSAGIILDTTQYVLAFAGIALGLAVIYKYLLPGRAMPSVTNFLGLEPKPNGPNGMAEVPCYSVPYKVMETQYGDQAILAGYNENVIAHETGAKGKYYHPHKETGSDCYGVDEKGLNYAKESA